MKDQLFTKVFMSVCFLAPSYQGRVIPCKYRLLCSVALCLNASVLPAKSTELSDKFLSFSSAISPGGDWIAENFGTNGCCDGGFVTIRKISEPSSLSDIAVTSASGSPGLFMIWQDDKNLHLVQDSNFPHLNGPNTYKGITISYSTYQNRPSDNHTFDVANVSKNTLSIREEDVSAENSEEMTKTGRLCRFSISAKDGTFYDKVGAHIEAQINRCDRVRDCAGISSEFWIGKRIDGRRGLALTSATVSKIPSYNRLPKGDRDSMVRGTFGESSAVDLVAALGSKAIDLQYSLNFFDTIISYRISTKQIANATQLFRMCIGDGDFNWMIHEKTKPNSSVGADK